MNTRFVITVVRSILFWHVSELHISGITALVVQQLFTLWASWPLRYVELWYMHMYVVFQFVHVYYFSLSRLNLSEKISADFYLFQFKQVWSVIFQCLCILMWNISNNIISLYIGHCVHRKPPFPPSMSENLQNKASFAHLQFEDMNSSAFSTTLPIYWKSVLPSLKYWYLINGLPHANPWRRPPGWTIRGEVVKIWPWDH